MPPSLRWPVLIPTSFRLSVIEKFPFIKFLFHKPVALPCVFETPFDLLVYPITVRDYMAQEDGQERSDAKIVVYIGCTVDINGLYDISASGFISWLCRNMTIVVHIAAFE